MGARLRVTRLLPRIALASIFVSVMLACGSRTGLFGTDDGAGGGSGSGDGGPGGRDGSLDGGEDALPPIDATPPTDAPIRNDCPDADATLIYVVTDTNELMSFDPAANAFTSIGVIACPAPGGTTPFSMAVDRKGIAYVVFNDGSLYRVSTATAACISTPFVIGQSGFETFGMGYATNAAGPTETLYVAGDSIDGTGAGGLATIDTTTFLLHKIGNFNPAIDRAELTGTGDGRLFAFYTKDTSGVGSFIGEIDTTNAHVIGENALPSVDQGEGWAFAFYGGDFYTFTAPTGSTVVNRVRLTDQTVTQVATTGSKIVGAGVSTCAPSQ